MNIKDYRILTGFLNAYIARPSKKGQVMLEPRREITEDEIMNLIAWWLDMKLMDAESESQIISLRGEPIIELKRLKKYGL